MYSTACTSPEAPHQSAPEVHSCLALGRCCSFSNQRVWFQWITASPDHLKVLGRSMLEAPSSALVRLSQRAPAPPCPQGPAAKSQKWHDPAPPALPGRLAPEAAARMGEQPSPTDIAGMEGWLERRVVRVRAGHVSLSRESRVCSCGRYRILRADLLVPRRLYPVDVLRMLACEWACECFYVAAPGPAAAAPRTPPACPRTRTSSSNCSATKVLPGALLRPALCDVIQGGAC